MTAATETRKQHILSLLHQAAAEAIQQKDPWAEYRLDQIPAERVIRHLYDPSTDCWSSDETIVKMQGEPFTHGAMRFCYRMKKRAQPPLSATNHRFHKHGWAQASNYVAKAYQQNGVVDTSEQAKLAVQNDIRLQYEAQRWAMRFNAEDPPTKIHFIRAYAIEFPDREGRPWLAVERFIAGTDSYGAGFVKHNTNSGFVDEELRRVTPQVFSAHSFYASEGTRLVADIQGVGDLYTDPQVLSSDYRFGDGDLGPRGMALFFKTFRHCGMSDGLGIPIFALSKNELKVQAKYEEGEETVSDDELSYMSREQLDNFQLLDQNRLRRRSLLKTPLGALVGEESQRKTDVRSNLTSRAHVSASFRQTLRQAPSPRRKIRRTQSDVDEVHACLVRAAMDREFSLMRDFHRRESGELRERRFKDHDGFHKSAKVRRVAPPMIPTDLTKINLGKVHHQLAVLHGMGRFPDVVPESEDPPAHDVFSVLFHLSHAASLQNPPALLALARSHAGLDTVVSELLPSIVATDLNAAKRLLHRAMESPQAPAAPKVAAGCLLFQILHDERHVLEGAPIDDDANDETNMTSQVTDGELMVVLQQTLELYDAMEAENRDKVEHQSTLQRGICLQVGDKVEANYMLEGVFYPAIVDRVQEDGAITVTYNDDGSSESLTSANVRRLVPPTATQTNLGGPLSDDEAFGEASDDKILLQYYELQAELAELKARTGEPAEAAALYQQAADRAMVDGKMKTATEWSLKAVDLC